MTPADSQVNPEGRYCPRPGVTVVRVADEALVLHPETSGSAQTRCPRRHGMDLLDGRATLEQTVTDISEAFGAPIRHGPGRM